MRALVCDFHPAIPSPRQCCGRSGSRPPASHAMGTLLRDLEPAMPHQHWGHDSSGPRPPVSYATTTPLEHRSPTQMFPNLYRVVMVERLSEFQAKLGLARPKVFHEISQKPCPRPKSTSRNVTKPSGPRPSLAWLAELPRLTRLPSTYP